MLFSWFERRVHPYPEAAPGPAPRGSFAFLWAGTAGMRPFILGMMLLTATIGAFVRTSERLHREFGTISLPVFIMHGTADKATVPAGSEEFFGAASSKDKTLKLYDGYVHDLLNDTGREGVLADIVAWLDKRAASG